MLLLEAEPAARGLEGIIPYLPLIVGVLVVAISSGVGVWNRRRGAVENRAPDVNEMWTETEKSRRARRFFEDLYFELRMFTHNYVRLVQSGGSTDLTAEERAVYDRDPFFNDKLVP